MKKCTGTVEQRGHTTYWAPCVLQAGHYGNCSTSLLRPAWFIGKALVSYPVDANGAPL